MELWTGSSKECEGDCQCSGLIMESFRINSGNNATKRRREEAVTNNYKIKMSPHSLDFSRNNSPLKSPLATTSKRRVLGEIQNSPIFLQNSPISRSPLKTPLIDRKSPLIEEHSPLTSRSQQTYIRRSSTKISRIFEERSKFKMSNKENEKVFISETFVKFDVEEETRDTEFGVTIQSSISESKVTNWSVTNKLNFTDALPSKSLDAVKEEVFVPEKEIETEMDGDFETLHDLEEEFDADNFDQCTKYEIISTDSPNIISRGRPSSSRKITSRNFVFGAPLAENEPSTSFNRPNANATRMLNFEDENFEFPSPAIKRSSSANMSVKKSLKFSETPTKIKLRHDKSDSSIGSMPSPASTKLRIFPSESSTSMESGFVSEFEEPFLDIEESNSPMVSDFKELLSAQIKVPNESEFCVRRPTLQRSLSLNPETSKARMSLFSILESPNKKGNKRSEPSEEDNVSNKRRKSNCENPDVEKIQRPILHRAYSENNASIMSALARSVVDPDLIGDFTLPFALPLTSGDHSDLKSISCDTLAGLLRGEYEHSINDFQVIDCRYPYEYEGGHILGAVNLYTPDQILTLVNKPLQSREQEDKRSILVFHCEFSLERGPKLSRFLRSSDRAKNKENYPSLHYPEIYLLHEGYRAFYHRHPDLCSPVGYTAMLDPKHRHQLRQHRSVQPSSSSSSASSHHRRHRLLL